MLPSMAQIGERANLKILREVSSGVFLAADGELGEVLLPRRELPREWEVGGMVEVFLYTDSEDRPVATMKHPKAMPGEFASLKVVAITGVGAFLDWGLPKDLLLPFREQKEKLREGRSYVVRVYVDPETKRIVASRRLSRYLDKTPPKFSEGEEVDLLVYGRTDLGYKAIINNTHSGVLFENQVFRELRAGERTRGYVTQVRRDGKIDLSLYQPGKKGIDSLEKRIEIELAKRGGFLRLTDKSSPEEIEAELGVSKKAFKKAVGALYKRRRITLGEDGVRLV